MKKFHKLFSTCLPVREENIDTDQIVPARFLKVTSREGFGTYLFYDWRFDKSFGGAQDKSNTKCVFNNPKYKGAKILVAGNNFGCGSSREHAAWAIAEYGFRVVVSSSFGDIFYNNALKNGLLPISVKPKELEILFQIIEKKSQTEITVDLKKQKIHTFHFPIDSFRKTCLLKGVDELGYILSHEGKIKQFEQRQNIFV
ncbi:3-isopropylmalate dehydratase small subunit [Candidatus Gottesmanbacteria bacterium]|nr:3-isopropylmalate dehydratase small subunit [Candidatus Gottesmanbacteria bacterium]